MGTEVDVAADVLVEAGGGDGVEARRLLLVAVEGVPLYTPPIRC